MNRRYLLLAVPLCILLNLGACGGSPGAAGGTDQDAPPVAHGLGVIRISVDGLGSPTPTATAENLGQPDPANITGPQAHALTTQPCFLQIQSSPVSSGAFNANGEQYVSFTFKVRNAQGVNGNGCTLGTPNAALANVTLLGLVEPGLAISGTPFISLKEFDGSNAPASVATTILPTHGMQFDAEDNAVEVAPGQESLQVFSEASLAGLAIDPEDASGSYLLPYGFVVRNVDPAQGRTLQANPAPQEYDGEFTFAVKLPTPGVKKTAVYSFQYDLQVLVDSNTRVTQSAEEQNPLGDIAANLRAAGLKSADLAVLGGSHVVATDIGDPLCTVRIAGAAGAATAYLANNGAGANVVAIPYNLQNVEYYMPINAGFCQPMQQVPNGSTNMFAVSGSQSGPHTSGSYGGGGSTVLSYYSDQAHPFFPGEQVSFSLTNALTTVGGSHPAPFVGSYTVASYADPLLPLSLHGTTVQTGASPMGVAAGDFNGDGIADLVVANSGDNTITVEFGNSDGSYTSSSVFSAGSAPQAVAVGDLNSDGHLDIVVAYGGSTGSTTGFIALLGKGDGTFLSSTITNISTAASGPSAIAIADMNGDGVPDIVVANASSNNVTVFLLHNNFGAFSVTSTTNFNVGTSPRALAIGDWNGNGRPDIAVANAGSSNVSILLNNGSGGFTAGATVAVGLAPLSIVAADFNHDGHPDLAVANYFSGTISILKNNGSGVFSLADTLSGAGTGLYSLVAADFDLDGYPDLAVTATGGSGNLLTVLINARKGLNNQAGDFTISPPLVTGGQSMGLAAVQLDGDNYPDLLLSNSLNNTLFVLNNYGRFGPGIFGGVMGTDKNPAGVVAGDFNGDGALDMAVANNGSGAGNTVTILTSAGSNPYGNVHAGFTSATVTVGHGPQGIASGNFFGLGKLDLAVANTSDNTVSLLRNSGSGTFVCCTNLATGAAPFGIAVGDFNGDGAPDLAVTNSGNGTVSVFLYSTSTASYVQAAGSPIAVGQTPEGIVIGDFNGDGKLDFATSNYDGGSINVMLGNGSGGFVQASGSPILTGSAGAIVIGDFNGDGIPDLVVSGGVGSTQPCSESGSLYLGKGDGTFAQTPHPYFDWLGTGATPVCSTSLIAGDFDGDGKLDLAAAGYGVIEMLGDGAGGFKSATPSILQPGFVVGGMAAGDFFRSSGGDALNLVISDSNFGSVELLDQR